MTTDMHFMNQEVPLEYNDNQYNQMQYNPQHISNSNYTSSQANIVYNNSTSNNGYVKKPKGLNIYQIPIFNIYNPKNAAKVFGSHYSNIV